MSSNFSNPPGLPLQRAPNPINNLPDERNHPSASRAEMMPLAHSNGSDIQLAQYSIHPDALRPPQIRSKPSSSNLSRPSTSNLGHSPSKERMSVAFRDSVSNSSPPSLRDSGYPKAVPRPPKLRPTRLATSADKKEMFSDHYCCFAIPLYNVGIYVILAQFAAFGLVSGILGFSAPSVLAIAVPDTVTAIFGVLCILIGLVQAMGFYGVYKERPAVFKKYIILNAILVLITLIYSMGVIVISSTRHNTAIEQCLLQFVSNDDLKATTSASGRTVCNIWTWAQLGICGFLWALFAGSEIYFCLMERRWGQDQKIDHLKYRSIISAVRESMAVRPSAEWDAGSRAGSIDGRSAAGYQRHTRGGSSASAVPSIGAGLTAPPVKSSRLRNEIEWKEMAISNGPSTPNQSTSGKTSDSTRLLPHETGQWNEAVSGSSSSARGEQAAPSDAEFYRAAAPRH